MVIVIFTPIMTKYGTTRLEEAGDDYKFTSIQQIEIQTISKGMRTFHILVSNSLRYFPPFHNPARLRALGTCQRGEIQQRLMLLPRGKKFDLSQIKVLEQ